MRRTKPSDDRSTSSTARWRSVLARDRAADGEFIYAVSSTGIYCRPSCPSRKPARQFVQFFDVPADAEAAGYRACRRCEPRRVGGSPNIEKIRLACAYIDAHADEPLTLEAMGKEESLSQFNLQRCLQRKQGNITRQYRTGRIQD